MEALSNYFENERSQIQTAVKEANSSRRKFKSSIGQVHKMMKTHDSKLLTGGIDQSDFAFLKGVKENYEKVTRIRAEVEDSDKEEEEGKGDVHGGATPGLESGQTTFSKDDKNMVPIYEKFPEIEQDADLHHAIIDELDYANKFDEKEELQGAGLIDRLLKIADEDEGKYDFAQEDIQLPVTPKATAKTV